MRTKLIHTQQVVCTIQKQNLKKNYTLSKNANLFYDSCTISARSKGNGNAKNKVTVKFVFRKNSTAIATATRLVCRVYTIQSVFAHCLADKWELFCTNEKLSTPLHIFICEKFWFDIVFARRRRRRRHHQQQPAIAPTTALLSAAAVKMQTQ